MFFADDMRLLLLEELRLEDPRCSVVVSGGGGGSSAAGALAPAAAADNRGGSSGKRELAPAGAAAAAKQFSEEELASVLKLISLTRTAAPHFICFACNASNTTRLVLDTSSGAVLKGRGVSLFCIAQSLSGLVHRLLR